MGTDVINTSAGVFKKVATMQSTSLQDPKPKAVVVDRGLTVFLGGAGMVGAYNEDMVAAFKEAGTLNPVYGNYSSLIAGLDKYVISYADMLSDAHLLYFTTRMKMSRLFLNMVKFRNASTVASMWRKNTYMV